jgi:hypothetical protein
MANADWWACGAGAAGAGGPAAAAGVDAAQRRPRGRDRPEGRDRQRRPVVLTMDGELRKTGSSRHEQAELLICAMVGDVRQLVPRDGSPLGHRKRLAAMTAPQVQVMIRDQDNRKDESVTIEAAEPLENGRRLSGITWIESACGQHASGFSSTNRCAREMVLRSWAGGPVFRPYTTQ